MRDPKYVTAGKLAVTMVPSNFKKLDFVESGRDSKQLFKKYAAERASEAIAQRRRNKVKGAPADLIAALGSNETICF